ncbi:hypothetical protein FGE12_25330 [Aggregicoccus sp. 17bor-14]|uniref:hypothetical protein n=1 Tax=Myxococcaceae TaxID=31 RepID=UPI00129C9AED|nr:MULTISPECIES: hypothetical protein [Myxococcaceae]MBF5045755.1 hypothetical protein [Simulacricoccus sp. 17bor-14]MRI91490.1 hypothetical protein [Aggregicoccus sp. 17bor-14]
MSDAVCVKCGSRKDGAFAPCAACGLDPAEHRALQAKSLLLSAAHASPAELAEAERRLKAGQPVAYAPERLAALEEELRTQQTPLLQPAKRGLPPIVWLPVVVAAAVVSAILYAFFSH